MAESTGLEPAASRVTGERYNQLNYDSAQKIYKRNWGVLGAAFVTKPHF